MSQDRGRKVFVQETVHTKKVDGDSAVFLAWSTVSDDDGGHSPVAIIELENGRVDWEYATRIRFSDKDRP